MVRITLDIDGVLADVIAGVVLDTTLVRCLLDPISNEVCSLF